MLGILIWLLGAIISYFLARYTIRKYSPPYRQKDRTLSIILSLLISFIAAIFWLIIILIENSNNKPAKW
jgi:4-amino-4-deoxy-L-arabinose transferase-like glycosyltransferase